MRRVFRIPFSQNRITREVDDELAFHLEMRIQKLVSTGWSHEAAEREAAKQFGDFHAVRESIVTLDQQREQSMQRVNLMSEFIQDVHYAVRSLRHNVTFSAMLVVVLAVGIGANTAIFTLIDAVLMRGLPVEHPEQLVAVGKPTRVSSIHQGTPRPDLISVPLYRDIRANNQVFSDVLATGRADRFDVRIDSGSAEAEHPSVRYVSGNYFSVLGVRPFRGRVLESSMDDTPGSAAVIVISHGYWTRRFANDPAAIGRVITINGVKMTIIGVTPPSFTGEVVGLSPDFWTPISMHDVLRPHDRMLNDRTASWLLLLGRLKPGATLAQAEKEIPIVMQRSIVANSDPATAQSFVAGNPEYLVTSGARGLSSLREAFRAPLLTLMIGVALLLCIICANVATLLLSRAIARGQEMAVRLALGAGRRRLVRQVLAESAILALLAAALGLVIAWWGSHALLLLASSDAALPSAANLDLRLLGFTFGVSTIAVGLFGLAPALRASRVDLASTMRAGANAIRGAAHGGRAPLGRMLIAMQVALSMVLLIGAAMLVRSFRNLEYTEVGLDRDHLVIVGADITSRSYTPAQLATLVRAISARLSALPGVAAVTFSNNGIFSGTESGMNVQIPGFVPRTADDSTIAYDQVGAGYATAIGARIIAGRDLSAMDEDRLPRTALVNQSLASFYFPHTNAVGQYLHFDSVAVQIVGVIGDTRDHELTEPPERRAYFPYVHAVDSLNFDTPGRLRFAVRTAGDPTPLVQTIQRTASSVDPQLPIAVNRLTTMMQASISEQRLLARLSTTFGVVALLLAAFGLYGVMTYAITRRTSEIGLRVALGASSSSVVRMVLFDGLRLVAIGIVIGLPFALLSARLLQTQLHDVPVIDPLSIIVAVTVLSGSAIVAALLPALRASRVSPITALRAG